MSLLQFPGGSFSSVFCGNYGASSVLSRLTQGRTDGSQIIKNTNTEYVVALDQYCITGNTTLNFSLTFYADTGIAWQLANSLSITGSDTDTPDPTQQYVLLLINSDSRKQSYLCPRIKVKINANPNYNKDKPTTIIVNFQDENIDPAAVILTPGTPSELSAILSSRSPI